MKTLAFLLTLLFAVPAFADDLDLISVYESDGVVYTIDITPEPYQSPEPVDTDVEHVKIPDALKPDLIDVLNFFFVNSLN